MSATEKRTHVSPFCSHLASKKVSLLDGLPMCDADVLDASNHCWCEATMQVLGPDRQLAHPEDCRKGRECFESPFDSML